MSDTVTELLDKALQLPEADRAEIAETLIASLGDVEPSPEVEAAWQKEIARRLEQIESGKVKCIPWEKVRAKLTEITGA